MFINLSNRGVDYDAFKSVNGSFLVFDSRLVIDATFRTSDSAIYGAGPVTKFSRCYHSEEWSHANFNSKEVGQDLAATMLPLFDPTRELADEQPPEEGRLVPLYRRAKVQGRFLHSCLCPKCVVQPQFLHFFVEIKSTIISIELRYFPNPRTASTAAPEKDGGQRPESQLCHCASFTANANFWATLLTSPLAVADVK